MVSRLEARKYASRSITGRSVDGASLLSARAGNTSAASAGKSAQAAVVGEDEEEVSTLEHPNAARDESGYTRDYYSMEPAVKRMFLRMLNSSVRPSVAARRTGVERDIVSPMTVDREEKEDAAAWKGEITSWLTARWMLLLQSYFAESDKRFSSSQSL